MRATQLLRSAKKSSGFSIPYEVWPLIVCMGGVTVYATYRLAKNYSGDEVRAGHQQTTHARLPSTGEH